MIAVNVHLHGDADWKIETGKEVEFIQKLLEKLELDDKTFAVLGYSIGARLAMRIAAEFPERVSELILLAPDGVYSPPVFQYANKTKAGRKWMERLVKKPGLILSTLKMLSKVGVYSDVIYKFYYNRFNTEEKRAKLKHVWRIMSGMTPMSAAPNGRR